MADEIKGKYGVGRRIPRDNYAEHSPATLDSWVIDAPMWHPLWSQYFLGVITLAPVPGVRPAHKDRPDATHELMVMTLNPERGPYDASAVGAPGSLGFLTPGNIAEQFRVAADDHAVELAGLCVKAVVIGLLSPETADAPELIREAWRQAIHTTLDHRRDPHHGRSN